MSNTTREHKDIDGQLEGERQREFMSAILDDVRALEHLIEHDKLEKGVRRIGAEQELFLIDQSWRPARGVLQVLDKLHHEKHYTTELGQFQLEANADPQLLADDGIAKLHAQLDALVEGARRAARSIDMDVVLMGILPTMRKADLGLDNMVPSARYMQLNKIVTAMRGGKFDFAIKGLDELILDHDSVMLEACNSSFQVHLQVGTDEFARMYNLAQVLAGPLMAVSANSPIVFGRRLWAETRIALFRQAVDSRRPNLLRETEARVHFGTRWVRKSIVEIFKEDIARFRALVGTELGEDPMMVIARGGVPELKALRLHSGTIYRWNRACYGIMDGKAHLRIENRIMPAGPSVIDQVANAAFWAGMMVEIGAREEDVTRRIDFDQAGANFYTAAREGIGAHFTWLDGEDIGARALVLERLLPLAEAGLRRQKVNEADIKKYLGVVEERVSTGRTGSRWQLSSWNSLRDRATSAERSTAVVAATVQRQLSGRPVSEWERARLDEAKVTTKNYARVEHYMTSDLFTVHANDAVEMVANLMIWERIRHVPVEDGEHRLVGVLTHRAVLRFIMSGGSVRRTPVADIMKRDVATVGPDTPTIEALRLMRRLKVGCLPVVHDDKLVGIITEEDFMELASKLLEEQLGSNEQLALPLESLLAPGGNGGSSGPAASGDGDGGGAAGAASTATPDGDDKKAAPAVPAAPPT